MRIHLVFPVLPPRVDGIADYTACLAGTLAARAQVKILTGQGRFDEVEGVEVEQAFSLSPARGVAGVAAAVLRDAPDWLVVQYNPFSYGRWGLNPSLPQAIRRIKREAPQVRLALMVHEPFVPVTDWKSAIMTTWQRRQLYALARLSDVVFFSIMPWAEAFRARLPGCRVRHLPVGSNIPRVDVSRREARGRVGIDDEALVVGVFGSAHPSRLLPFIHEAVQGLAAAFPNVRVLCIGTSGSRLSRLLGSAVPLTDAGVLNAEAVSLHFAAMDLYLAPFRKGVSTRRGSFITGLQHGIATVSTSGVHTDRMLLEEAGSAFLLAPDDDPETFRRHVMDLARRPEQRARTAEAGRSFFEEHHAWERIADGLLEALAEDEVHRPHPALPPALIQEEG